MSSPRRGAVKAGNNPSGGRAFASAGGSTPAPRALCFGQPDWEGTLADGTTIDEGAAWLICPICDRLHRRPRLAEGESARCLRCGSVIETRRSGAIDRVIAGSVAMIALMAFAATGPFLAIDRAGLTSAISLLDAADALAAGWTLPLGGFVALAVLGLPTLRAAAHLYALLPGRFGFRPPRLAAAAMRFSMRSRPWAMAEIFMVGVTVSLIKVAGLARVEPGAAFWALAGAVAVLGFENAALCRETVWAAVDRDWDRAPA